MFCASVAYPPDAERFDLDYFRDHHVPAFASMLGDNCVRFEVHVGVASPGGPPPPFRAAAYFWVASAERFGQALAHYGPEIYADIERFSNVQPVRGWSEVCSASP